MIWLLVALAHAGTLSANATGEAPAVVTVTLAAWSPPPPPPPPVLANRLEEPLERYLDTENRWAVVALRRREPEGCAC